MTSVTSKTSPESMDEASLSTTGSNSSLSSCEEPTRRGAKQKFSDASSTTSSGCDDVCVESLPHLFWVALTQLELSTWFNAAEMLRFERSDFYLGYKEECLMEQGKKQQQLGRCLEHREDKDVYLYETCDKTMKRLKDDADDDDNKSNFSKQTLGRKREKIEISEVRSGRRRDRSNCTR